MTNDSNGNDWRERMDRVERALDGITERHEALAQTVEIIAAMQRDNDATMGKLGEAHTKLAEAQTKQTEAQTTLAEAQTKNEVILAQVLESINSLARIARSHEQRLNDIEA